VITFCGAGDSGNFREELMDRTDCGETLGRSGIFLSPDFLWGKILMIMAGPLTGGGFFWSSV